MAHYAFLNQDNVVTHVIMGRDEDDLAPGVTSWEDYYSTVVGQTCRQTSYNTLGGVHRTDGEPSADQSKAFRGNYAGIGYRYDEVLDGFIPPTPYPSWVLDGAKFQHVPPVDCPAKGDYTWDEETLAWVPVA